MMNCSRFRWGICGEAAASLKSTLKYPYSSDCSSPRTCNQRTRCNLGMNFCPRLLHLSSPCFRSSSFFQKKSTPGFWREIATSKVSSGMENGEDGKVTTSPRYIDIGINLTDPVYQGIYHDTQRHPNDLEGVLARARKAGVKKLLVTGSDIESSKAAVELAKQYPSFIYTTLGIHPCASSSFYLNFNSSNHSTILSSLSDLFTTITNSSSSPLAAIGEIGLDYDRLYLCPKDRQLTSFALQLDLFLSLPISLPLFLHCRAAHRSFIAILLAKNRYETLVQRRGGKDKIGVVHSFTGTVEEMRELVEIGFLIGVNGCSLKTEENCEVVKEIPLERLCLETDGPWCEIRPSHEGWKYLTGEKGVGIGGENGGEGWKSVKKEKWMEGSLVKGRNEPCLITRLAGAVAGIKGVSVEVVAENAWENTVRVFGLGEVVEGEDN